MTLPGPAFRKASSELGTSEICVGRDGIAVEGSGDDRRVGGGGTVGEGIGTSVAVTAVKVGVRLEAAKGAVGDAGRAVGSAGAVVQAAKKTKKIARQNARSGMCGIIAGQITEIKEALKLET